ncbi:unnamed protein product, partial [Chrysoparadoxa australica]
IFASNRKKGGVKGPSQVLFLPLCSAICSQSTLLSGYVTRAMASTAKRGKTGKTKPRNVGDNVSKFLSREDKLRDAHDRVLADEKVKAV